MEEITDELKKLSRAWRPFDPNADPAFTRYRWKPAELYADAISVLFNAPGLLKAEAPNFYDAFFNYLENKPKFKSLYDNIQNEIAAGKANAALKKRTYDGYDEGDEVYGEVLERISIGDRFMRDLVDAHWMLIKKVRRVGEHNIEVEKNPRYKLEELVYTGSEIEWMLSTALDQMIRPLEKVGLGWKDLGYYRQLKRISENRKGVASPEGWYKERADNELKALEEEWVGPRWEAMQKTDKAFFYRYAQVLDTES